MNQILPNKISSLIRYAVTLIVILGFAGSQSIWATSYTLDEVVLNTEFDPEPRGEVTLEISLDPLFQPTLSTLSGTAGVSGSSDGPRQSALYYNPSGLAIDSDGNLFIADAAQHRIRMLDPEGNVTTIAGSDSGYVDGAGPNARFAFPSALVVGSDDNLYVADRINHVIRKLERPGSPGGIWVVTTFAGSGRPGFFDGNGAVSMFNEPQGLAAGPSGDLYVADVNNHRIRRISKRGKVSTYAGSRGGYRNGVKMEAQFQFPTGLDFDSEGNLYVADSLNRRIRKVTPGTGGVVSTVAGSGEEGRADGPTNLASFNEPISLVTDGAGHLFVVDRGSSTIRKITLADSSVNTLAGTGSNGNTDGPVSAAQLNHPTSIVIGLDGNLVIADSPSHTIRKLIIQNVSAPTTVTGGEVTAILDISSYGLNTYEEYFVRWIDVSAGRVQQNNLSFFIVDPPSLVRVEGTAQSPSSAILNGFVKTSGGETEVLFEYSTDPELRGPLAVQSLADFENEPAGFVMNTDGVVYLTFEGLHKIFKRTPDGSLTEFAGGSTAGFADGIGQAAQFDSPEGLTLDEEGNLYVADTRNHRVRRISSDGTVTTIAGSGVAGFADDESAEEGKFLYPSELCFLPNRGAIAVVDRGNERIRLVKLLGGLFTLAGSGSSGDLDGTITQSSFSKPAAVCADRDGDLYIADQGNHKIRRISDLVFDDLGRPISGKVKIFAGSGTPGKVDGGKDDAQFSSPSGIAVDHDGNIYVADTHNHCIRLITPDGNVTTFAGSGVVGSFNTPAGSIVPATQTQFDRPTAMILTPPTNLETVELHVIDSGNRGIRSVVRQALPSVPASQSPFASGSLGDPASLASLEIPETLWPGATLYFRLRAENQRSETVSGIENFKTPTNQNISIRNGEGQNATLLNSENAVEVDFDTQPFGVSTTRSFTLTNDGEWPLVIESINLEGPYQHSLSLKPSILESGETLMFQVEGPYQEVPVSGNGGVLHEGRIEIVSNDPDSPSITLLLRGVVQSPPVIETLPAENQTLKTADLLARVNPNGTATSLWFAYSRDPELDGFDVTKVTGSVSGFSNGSNAEAKFSQPYGLVFDSQGNLYMADTQNHVIRIVSPDGITSTYAGDGIPGNLNGPASSARFNEPKGIALGEDGTLYVADFGNHLIRAISPDGIVRTMAGTGEPSFTDGDSSAARFNGPSSLVIDELGNLLVADRFNHRVRLVGPDGQTQTLLGSGTAGHKNGPIEVATLDEPVFLVRDFEGSLYFTEASGHAIRKLSSDDMVTVLAGARGVSGFEDGETSLFNTPRGLAFGRDGNLFVADSGNHSIRKVSPTGLVTTIAGSGSAGDLDGLGDLRGIDGAKEAAEFDAPTSIVFGPDGNIYVGEITHGTIRKLTSSTIVIEVASDLNGADPIDVRFKVENLESYVSYYFQAYGSNFGGASSRQGAQIENFQSRSRAPFEAWQLLHYKENANNPLVAGPNAKAGAIVQDGEIIEGTAGTVENLQKYAHGIDPYDDALVGLPVINSERGRLILRYTKSVEATDVIFTVESSLDLQNWELADDIILQSYSNDGVTEKILASVPVGSRANPTQGISPARNLRLRLTLVQQP